MIYVNGDSHCAGAEAINDYCFAQDDPRYLAWGSRAHPDNIPYTFGYKLATTLNQPFLLEAESGSSNDRILRTTKSFIENTKNKKDMFIIIGWTTFEREEWPIEEIENGYIQISASGRDMVPKWMEEEYKNWVIKQTPDMHIQKEILWHNKINQFHLELKDQNIKHLFFNTYWHLRIKNTGMLEWHDQYIDPYDRDSTFYFWCKNKGFEPRKEGWHYGVDAHNAYFLYLLDKVKKQYNIQTGLTDMPKRSIVIKVNKSTMRQ